MIPIFPDENRAAQQWFIVMLCTQYAPLLGSRCLTSQTELIFQWLCVVQRYRRKILHLLYYCITYYLLWLENLPNWTERHWWQLTTSLAHVFFLPLTRSINHEPGRCCLPLISSTYHRFHSWFLFRVAIATFHRLCSLGWPKFGLHFLMFSLTRKFVPFGKIVDLTKDLVWQKIFKGRSTNLKIEKSVFFFAISSLLLSPPYFISFPDTQWAYKITTENINIKMSLNRLKKIVFFSPIFFYL